MRPDVEAATERARAARARLADLPHGVASPETEGELCLGYAQALEGDAWLARLDSQLSAAIDDSSSLCGGRELRAIAAEHGEFLRSLVALRRELAALRDEHDRLRLSVRAA